MKKKIEPIPRTVDLKSMGLVAMTQIGLDNLIKERDEWKYQCKFAQDKNVLLKEDLANLIEDVYKFAGRPTKDGAKLLRENASILEEEYALEK